MPSSISSPRQLLASSCAGSETSQRKGQLLAEKLQLPFVEFPEAKKNPLVLCHDNDGVALCQFQGRDPQLRKILYVDFLHGKHGYRLIHNRTISQDLARAVGIKRGLRPTIFDATAGLGGDTFVFASLGCKVFACERNPIIATLLADGIKRAAAAAKTKEIAARITLLEGESQQLLSTYKADTVYLDPMYPYTRASAEKKLSMRLIRELAGDDADGEELFTAAERSGTRRIVVKRPKKAPTVSTRKPDHIQLGKSCRYDIYFQHPTYDTSPQP